MMVFSTEHLEGFLSVSIEFYQEYSIMEHLPFFYLLFTLFTGVASVSISGYVYVKTREPLVKYYLYLYSSLTLLLISYAFLSYTQVNIPEIYPQVFKIQEGFQAVFAGPLLLVTLSMFYHSLCSVPPATVKNWIIGGLGFLIVIAYMTTVVVANETLDRITEYTAHTIVVLVMGYTVFIGIYYARKLQDHERKTIAIKSVVLFGIFLPVIVYDVFTEEMHSAIRLSPLHYCLMSVMFIHHFIKYYLHRHPEAVPAISDEIIFTQYNISPREQEVVRLVLEGRSNQEIGEKLFISLSTVKTHVSNIYLKLGVKNRIELLTFFQNARIS